MGGVEGSATPASTPLKEGRKCYYLTTHSTHFIYGYMALDIWLRTILIVRKETRCCHIGYSFRLTARVLLYAPSHRQDSTYHDLCYTNHGALAGTRNSSMGSFTTELHLAPIVDLCHSCCISKQGVLMAVLPYSFIVGIAGYLLVWDNSVNSGCLWSYASEDASHWEQGTVTNYEEHFKVCCYNAIQL